jgi:hypothetical protein
MHELKKITYLKQVVMVKLVANQLADSTVVQPFTETYNVTKHNHLNFSLPTSPHILTLLIQW